MRPPNERAGGSADRALTMAFGMSPGGRLDYELGCADLQSVPFDGRIVSFGLGIILCALYFKRLFWVNMNLNIVIDGQRLIMMEVFKRCESWC